MLAAKLPDIMSASIMFENILSIRVLGWIVILVGCKIKSVNELDASDVDATIKPKTQGGLNEQTSCTQQLKVYLAPKRFINNS